MKSSAKSKQSIDGNIKKIRKILFSKLAVLKIKFKHYYKKILTRVEKRPVVAFFGLILILFGLILISHYMNKPVPSAEEISISAKEIQVYSIGATPKITVQAMVEKSGVIKVVSLGSGIVQDINVEVGQEVDKRTNLVSMSTNYQGGNAFSVQRQLAQEQYKNVLDTYDAQKEIINKQKELAGKQDENSDELRSIANQSLGSTRSIIELNNSILSSLETQQIELENTNVNGANETAILQLKQLRSQYLAANNQLQSGLNNTAYTVSGENPPAEMSNISKEIALKQLEIQEKALALGKEVSRLSVLLTKINEAIMFPVSPVAGKVERIYVKVGQAISPGTPIAQITGDSKSFIAVALLSRETASAVSRSVVSTMHFGNETYEAVPFYVSSEATDGQLLSAQYAIPEEFNSKVSDRGYILVEIPIDLPQTGSTVPFIPIDSVFQTQDDDFVFIVKNGIAENRKVQLGTVVGRYVEVKGGLSEGDQVILNRNIIAGDPVKIVSE